MADLSLEVPSQRFLGSGHERLVDAASTLLERLDGGFTPADEAVDEGTVSRRLDRWCRLVAGDDREAFERRLSWDGLDIGRVRTLLGRVRRGDDRREGSWVQILSEVLETATAVSTDRARAVDPEVPVPFEEVLLAFVATARRLLAARDDVRSVELNDSAWVGLERGLLGSLSSLAGRCLQLEFERYRALRQNAFSRVLAGVTGIAGRGVYQAFVGRLRDGHLDLFLERYAMLARLLAQEIDCWVERMAELLRRLDADIAEIEGHFARGEPLGMVERIRRRVPHVALRTQRVLRSLYADAEEDNFKAWAECDTYRMKQMQAYIGLRGSHNVSEHSDIPDDQMKRVARLYQKPVHFEQRVPHTKWCVLRWPTPAMAQMAEMSTEAFEKFYFDVCTLDYARMESALRPLTERMRSTDQVRITGPEDTDLRFSIKNIEVVGCSGTHNIPDGECSTAPVRDSVEGVIHFNTPTIYNGISFENVRLVFK